MYNKTNFLYVATRRMVSWASVAAAMLLAVLLSTSGLAEAARPGWQSSVTANGETLPVQIYRAPSALPGAPAAATSMNKLSAAKAVAAPTALDLVVSLESNPQADERKRWVEMMEHFADGVWESTNGAHKLRNIRIYRNGKNTALANVIWHKNDAASNGTPHVKVKGGVASGGAIHMYEMAKWSGGTTYNYYADPENSGYTMAHEMGHYWYGLYDEYALQAGDVIVTPSIMNSQWCASNSGCGVGGGVRNNKAWLNFSIPADDTPGGDFENTQTTEQHRRFTESAWETLQRSTTSDPADLLLGSRTYYSELVAAAPAAGQAPGIDLPNNNTRASLYYLDANGDVASGVTIADADARSQLKVIWMEGLDVVLVLDRSGSMTSTMMGQAQQAAKALVDQFDDTSRVAVVSFSSSVTTNIGLTLLDTAAARTSVKSQIDSLSAYGSTAIGDAARTALNLHLADLALGGKANRVVFLLTDGENNAGEDPLSVMSDYQQAQIPLFTFGFGSGASLATLSQMATQTGGKYYYSPTTLSQITQVFQDAQSIASSSPSLVESTLTAAPGAPVQTSFVVDAAMSRLSVTATFPGATSAASITLSSPSNVIYSPDSVTAVGSESQALFTVDQPEAGIWLLDGTAATGSVQIGVNVSGSVDGKSFDLSVMPQLGEDTVVLGGAVGVTARLVKDTAITGLEIAATLTAPSGQTAALTFRDDGTQGDATAQDGLYTASFTPAETGAHQIDVNVANSGGTARYTGIGNIFSAGPDGEISTGALEDTLTEDFSRHASLTLTVTADWPVTLNARNLQFTPSGDADWVDSTDYAVYGSNAAKSGTITHSQSSTLTATVSGAGELSFYWKVSSESCCDYLKFYIDGVLQNSLSGTQEWARKTYTLASGSHTLSWTYSKDGSVSSGSDAGWIDWVNFTDTDTANAAGVSRMFVALFGRAPAEAGMTYWKTQLAAGTSLAQVAGDMFNTQPARTYYPVATPATQAEKEALITAFFTNVLGRAPLAGGLAYWVGQLDTQTIGQVITDMVQSVVDYDRYSASALALDTTTLGQANYAQDWFNNKTEVANHYASVYRGDSAGATSILQSVTDDPLTAYSVIGGL
ncbi:MAG: VWA domain-containing protein [Sideroxyarcus sp.]|nr:VWA domain-containing protein [Sideroxyarcus sp.]